MLKKPVDALAQAHYAILLTAVFGADISPGMPAREAAHLDQCSAMHQSKQLLD